MILAFVAMQAIGPVADDMQRPLRPVPVAEAVALFQNVCFMPFPDPDAAYAAAEKPEFGLAKRAKAPAEAMHPGDAWLSDRARVTYVNADWLPRDLPSPQCSVSATLEGGPEHLAIEAAFIAAMALPPGKGGKNKPRGQTQWDLPHAPDTWRLFVSTSTTTSGKELRATIMNLRGKKSK